MGRPAGWEYLMTPKERRNLRAMRVLIAGKGPTEAAAKVGISERTLYRLGLVRRAKEILAAKGAAAKAG